MKFYHLLMSVVSIVIQVLLTIQCYIDTCYDIRTFHISLFSCISGQMVLLDRFFDGTFFTYGIEVMSFADRDQEDRIDPMIYVFPRMTKCTFHKFGTSGNIEKHDALCILPLNIVNEKIYIFIWFWLLFLGLLSFLVLVYRVAIIFSPYIRAFVLRMRYRRVKRECVEMVRFYMKY